MWEVRDDAVNSRTPHALFCVRSSNSMYCVISHGTVDKVFPSKVNVDGSDIVVVDYQTGGRVFTEMPYVLTCMAS